MFIYNLSFYTKIASTSLVGNVNILVPESITKDSAFNYQYLGSLFLSIENT